MDLAGAKVILTIKMLDVLLQIEIPPFFSKAGPLYLRRAYGFPYQPPTPHKLPFLG